MTPLVSHNGNVLIKYLASYLFISKCPQSVSEHIFSITSSTLLTSILRHYCLSLASNTSNGITHRYSTHHMTTTSSISWLSPLTRKPINNTSQRWTFSEGMFAFTPSSPPPLTITTHHQRARFAYINAIKLAYIIYTLSALSTRLESSAVETLASIRCVLSWTTSLWLPSNELR